MLTITQKDTKSIKYQVYNQLYSQTWDKSSNQITIYIMDQVFNYLIDQVRNETRNYILNHNTTSGI